MARRSLVTHFRNAVLLYSMRLRQASDSGVKDTQQNHRYGIGLRVGMPIPYNKNGRMPVTQPTARMGTSRPYCIHCLTYKQCKMTQILQYIIKNERLVFSLRVPIENNGQCISMHTPNLITTSIQITFNSYLFWVLVDCNAYP